MQEGEDELEGNSPPSTPFAPSRVGYDSDASTASASASVHVKRPIEKTGGERGSKKARLSRQTKQVVAVGEAWDDQSLRDHDLMLAKIKVEEQRLALEEKRLAVEKEHTTERLAIERSRMEKQDERMEQIISILVSHLPKPS